MVKSPWRLRLQCLVGGRVAVPAVKRTEAEEGFQKACRTFALLRNAEDPWFERQVSVKGWLESSACFTGVGHAVNAHRTLCMRDEKQADVFVFQLNFFFYNILHTCSFPIYGGGVQRTFHATPAFICMQSVVFLVRHQWFPKFRTNRRDLGEQQAPCKINKNCRLLKI